ncbi:MAG: hypothetical protein ACKON8_14180, partial [Planctomycetota bacterium]
SLLCGGTELTSAALLAPRTSPEGERECHHADGDQPTRRREAGGNPWKRHGEHLRGCRRKPIDARAA